MYHVGGNLLLNIQQMAPWIILEDMGTTYCESDQDPASKCIVFIKNVVMLVLALYALSVVGSVTGILHPIKVSYSQLWYFVKVRGSPPRLSHNPNPSIAPDIHSSHAPFQNSLFQAVIHRINPPSPKSTYWTISHNSYILAYTYPFINPITRTIREHFHRFFHPPLSSLYQIL